MDDIVETTSGLQTAWLLATLGTRTNTRKTFRKDILSVSIPDVCSEVDKMAQSKSIRYSSNLLYGLSLIYKSKVDYFLSDISLMKTRLQREFLMKGYMTRSLEWSSLESRQSNVGTNNVQLFLSDDPSFVISIDLVPPFPFDSAPSKRRKLDIQRLDEENFPNTITMIHYTENTNPFLSTTTVEDERISNFMDRELQLTSAVSAANSSAIDFAFNESGNIVEYNAKENDEPEQNGISDFDLSDISELPLEVIESKELHGTNTITFDGNFHLSTMENQTSFIPSLFSQPKPTKFSYFDLDLDSAKSLTMSKSELETAVLSYESRMKQAIEPLEVPVDKKYEELVRSLSHSVTNNQKIFQYICLSNIIPDLESGDRWREISRVIRDESEIDRLTRVDNDLEVGRDFQELKPPPTHFDDFNDFAIDEEVNLSRDFLNQDDSVFAISFSELDRSEIRSRSRQLTRDAYQNVAGSNFNPSHSSGSSYSSSGMDPSLSLSAQLVKFYKFVQARASLYGSVDGERYSHLLSINGIVESNEYRKIQFSALIPSVSTYKEFSETPINRNLAANSFASLLALASRSLIGLEVEGTSTELGSGQKIEVRIPA